MAFIGYKKLFMLDLKHTFYASGYTSDFIITPTPETLSLLNKYHLQLRNTERGIIVLQSIDSDVNQTPAYPFPGSSFQRFSFRLQLKNAYFTNYTAPLESSGNPGKFYCNNLNAGETAELVAASNELTKKKYEVYNSLFSQEFTSTNAGPITISIEDSTGAHLPLDQSIMPYLTVGSTRSYRYQVDLRAYPPGFYKIKHEGSLFKTLLIDNFLSDAQTYAIVDIYRDDNDNNKDYKISFTAKESVWTYYAVFKLGNVLPVSPAGAEINVFDTNHGSESYPTLIFDIEDNLSNDAIAAKLISQYPTADIIRFTSQDAIPAYEVAKMNLSLKKHPLIGSDTVYLTNIPNPSIISSKHEVIVVVEKS